ncbi:MAG: hypothetical protein P8L48_01705 [Synechococcus sp. cluster2_bin.44]|jgi:hypothetical protein|nr:hypothetical protein [Synechococcus sp. cluster2_bin.44]
MPRYALLRHTGAPDDPSGCHFDLLLEDGATCRTWRLADVPTIDAAQQDALPLPAHRLVWLDPRSAAVSGGRGWAERIGSGRYQGSLPTNTNDPVEITLVDGDLSGQLRIAEGHCWLHKP